MSAFGAFHDGSQSSFRFFVLLDAGEPGGVRSCCREDARAFLECPLPPAKGTLIPSEHKTGNSEAKQVAGGWLRSLLSDVHRTVAAKCVLCGRDQRRRGVVLARQATFAKPALYHVPMARI